MTAGRSADSPVPPTVPRPRSNFHICLLTGEFPPDRGGVGDYSARLAEALTHAGADVGVLTRTRAGRQREGTHLAAATPGGSSPPVLATIPAWDFRAFGPVLRAAARLPSPAIVHIQYQAGAFDLKGAIHLVPSVVRARHRGCRVVTTFHDFRIPYLFPKAGPLRMLANRVLARTSNVSIFAEPADRDLAGGPGLVIPIGSNIDPVASDAYDRGRARAELGAFADTMLVGYFGFLNRSKGVLSLIRAAQRAIDDGQPIRLALIGGEPGSSDPTDVAQARAIARSVDELGLRRATHITGFLQPSELTDALLACDMLVLPFVDGASMRRGSLMAALAHGLPTISTFPPDGHRASLLRHGQNVWLVSPGDDAALADAISRLATERSLRERLRVGALELAELCSWPSIARQTLEAYELAFSR